MFDQQFMLGLTAGVIQLLGYILYLTNKKIDPNPMTWLMFGYGTIILTILEWDKDASFAELILPIVCSILGFIVFARCWYNARKSSVANGKPHWWPTGLRPDGKFELISFICDLLITVGYVGSWFLAISGLLEEEARNIAVVTFLILSNLSVILEFLPITKSTYENPEKEHYAPWLTWTVAYSLLGVVTYQENGFWSVLMLYPALNAVTHLTVGALALRKSRVSIF